MLMAETWMEAFFKRVLTVMIDFKLYFIFSPLNHNIYTDLINVANLICLPPPTPYKPIEYDKKA